MGDSWPAAIQTRSTSWQLPDGLRPRFRHVVSEAERVGHAVAALRSDDIDAFGRLMRASHESLRADFEVSTPALDTLVDESMAAGAAGVRLTGAGFGGCVLALVPRAALDGFLERRRVLRGGCRPKETICSPSGPDRARR